MALSQHTLNVPTKAGLVRSHGSGVWDSSEAGATLVGVYVQASTGDQLRQAGATARGRITAGVVTVDVEAPVGAGTVPVVVTIDA